MRRIVLVLLLFISQVSNTTAQYWSPLGEGIGISSLYGEGWVTSLALYNGELYAGGFFDSAGGIAVNRIAKWNGSTWSDVGGGMTFKGGPNCFVRSMIVYNGELYVGGGFDSAGGVAARNIARWDGTNWSAVGEGTNGLILDFVVYKGELYAGGTFDTIGGITANRIAKWDGTTWSGLGTGIDPDIYVDHPTAVYSLVVNNGLLYAGGAFDTAGTVPANNVAQWDGNNWSALGSGITYGLVYSLTVFEDGICAGGAFLAAGNSSALNIAKWNGTEWSQIGKGMDFAVASVAVYDGRLYAGGFYPNYSSEYFSDGVGEYSPSNFISKWDGVYWSNLGQGVNGHVTKLLPSDSALYVAGGFTFADSIPAHRVAKWLGHCSNPSRPDSIYGNNFVCNSSTQSYFINPVPGATSYTWVLPETWPGYSSTDTITTTAYYDGDFTITVWANNGCGNGLPETVTVKVYVRPEQPQFHTGNNKVCKGTTQTYSVYPVDGATVYTWTLPPGWTGSSGSNSITTTAGGTGGYISVQAGSAGSICGTVSLSGSIYVVVDTLPPGPGEIAGSIYVSPGQTEIYKVDIIPGASHYNWSLDGGGILNGGPNSNSVSISWHMPGSHTLSLFVSNNCGNSVERKLTVDVKEFDMNDRQNPELFPNPSSGEFYLKAKRVQDKTIHIEVVNMSGQVVYRLRSPGTNNYSQLIDLKKMAPGLYAVKVTIDEKIYNLKVVKK